MAVRHGYGKIAGTDALVFAYDTGDTRNSYRGEPTTNLTTDTPSQNGWGGSYSLLESSTKTFQMQLDQAGAATAWRSWYWSVSSYVGSSITISFDFELLETSGADLLYFVMGQGNTGTYPNFIASSAEADKVTDSTGVSRHFTWSGIINSAGLVGCTMRMTNGVTNGYIKFKISNVQIEAKAHETPFINGTRSATQGLLDLTGNNSIDLSNASFNSNAEIEFDGTDSYVQTNFGDNISSQFTAEFIFYATTNQTHFPMQMYVSADTNTVFRVERFSAGADSIEFGHSDNGGSITGHELVSLNFPNNTWHHCTLVYDGSYKYIYKNGTLDTSTADSTITWYSGATLRIGARQNSSLLPLAGYMPVVKIYNRALTAAEIKNNYNIYKGRFNI